MSTCIWRQEKFETGRHVQHLVTSAPTTGGYPKSGTSKIALFLDILSNLAMKGPQMWPKSIMTCKYYQKCPLEKKWGSFGHRGLRYDFLRKKIWTVPLILQFNIYIYIRGEIYITSWHLTPLCMCSLDPKGTHALHLLRMSNCKINGTVHIFFLKKSYLSPRCPKLSHFFFLV